MRAVRVIHLTNQTVIAEKCFEAVRFFDRLRGLMGRTALIAGEAMWFPNCWSIHTCWMRMAIDVVFLRPSRSKLQAHPPVWEVVSVYSAVRPWRFWVGERSASAVLELAEGAAKQRGLSPGDEVYCEV
jgi:hypothetical protein